MHIFTRVGQEIRLRPVSNRGLVENGNIKRLQYTHCKRFCQGR